MVVSRPGSGLEPGRVVGDACAVIAVTSGLGTLTFRVACAFGPSPGGAHRRLAPPPRRR